MQKECESADSSLKGNMEAKLSKYSKEISDLKKKVKRKEDTISKLYDLHTLVHTKVMLQQY